MPRSTLRLAAAALLLGALVPAGAEEAPEAPVRWYTFAWPLDGAAEDRVPRGGTTEGTDVTPAAEPASEWQALQEPGLSARERDRMAILALAGEYRTTFDFLETVTYVPELAPARPYQSWATEYVFVVEDRPEFISLQHVLVMRFVEDGEVRGPFVQKHWRQDWRHEADKALVYLGDGRWEVQAREPEPGTWTQTVHQVDDTPRYAATGRWSHEGGFSAWEAERAWRPLPRRERTVRDDYDVMASRHRVSITPGGWVHEQDNLKVVLDEEGRPDPEAPYLAREQGVARYVRLAAYDFDAGRRYWDATAEYWSLVRAWWRRRLAEDGAFALRGQVDGEPLFVPLFRYAQDLEAGEPLDREAARAYLDETLGRYVRTD